MGNVVAGLQGRIIGRRARYVRFWPKADEIETFSWFAEEAPR